MMYEAQGMTKKQKRILVIDADVSSVEIIKTELEAEGHEVLTSETGKDGLYKALSEKPNLVILDIILPGLNGFELTRQLRQDPRTSKIPLLLLSSVYVSEDDIEEGLQIGTKRYHLDVDACMAKPLDCRNLVDQVKNLLGEKPATKSIDRAKILIIDDDPDVIELLMVRLKTKYNVVAALDGNEGMKKAKEHSPNVVFLDIMLPGIDGLEVLQKLKEAMPEVAIIIITAHGDEEIAGEALRRGANDYIAKPIEYREVEARTQENLEKNQLQLRNKELVEQLRTSNMQLIQRYMHVDQIVMEQAQKLIRYEQMMFETEREDAKRRLEGVLGSVMDGVIVTDPSARILLINPQAEEWFGIHAKEAIGEELPRQFKDPEIQSMLDAALIRQEHGYCFDFEWTTPHDHTKRLLRARLTTMCRSWEETPANLLGMVLTFSDVTHQMETVKELEFRFALLEKIVEIVISTDMDGRILTWNRAAETVFGYSASEILGDYIATIIPEEDFPVLWDKIRRTTEETGTFEKEIECISKGGNVHHLQLATALITDSTGNPDRLLLVAECVLKQKNPTQSEGFALEQNQT